MKSLTLAMTYGLLAAVVSGAPVALNDIDLSAAPLPDEGEVWIKRASDDA
jgi:hypothetical protein